MFKLHRQNFSVNFFREYNDIIECMMIVNNVVFCQKSMKNKNSDVQQSVARLTALKIRVFNFFFM